MTLDTAEKIGLSIAIAAVTLPLLALFGVIYQAKQTRINFDLHEPAVTQLLKFHYTRKHSQEFSHPAPTLVKVEYVKAGADSTGSHGSYELQYEHANHIDFVIEQGDFRYTKADGSIEVLNATQAKGHLIHASDMPLE